MMYSDLGSPSYTSAMMSIRPQHDPYRSLPVTPVGMDPRNIGSMDVAAAMNHARMGLEAQDYFSSSPRFAGNMRPSSPYPLAYEGESSYTSGPSMSADLNLSALINRTNLDATLANAQIVSTAKYGKVFPHMCEDGHYPTDFSTPKTVETMRTLDNSQLDRIMQSYRLPLDLSALPPPASSSSSSSGTRSGRNSPYGNSRDSTGPISSTRVRIAKLSALWEFLGVWKMVEMDALRRRGY